MSRPVPAPDDFSLEDAFWSGVLAGLFLAIVGLVVWVLLWGPPCAAEDTGTHAHAGLGADARPPARVSSRVVERALQGGLVITGISDLHSTHTFMTRNPYAVETNPITQDLDKLAVIKGVWVIGAGVLVHYSEKDDRGWVKWGGRAIALLLIGQQVKDTIENYQLANRRYDR